MTEQTKLERLEARVNADSAFLNSLKIMDYKQTKEIIDAVNKAVLSGIKPSEIISMLDILSRIK